MNPTFINLLYLNVPCINKFIPDGQVQCLFQQGEQGPRPAEVLIESFLVAGNQKLEPGQKPRKPRTELRMEIRCFQRLKWLAPSLISSYQQLAL